MRTQQGDLPEACSSWGEKNQTKTKPKQYKTKQKTEQNKPEILRKMRVKRIVVNLRNGRYLEIM